jgi:hypothetical protein
MRKIKAFLILLTVIVTIISCKKDSEGNIIIGMGAKVDGDSWSALVPLAALYNNTFTITGTSLTGKTIVVTIDGNSEGTYKLSVIPPAADCGCTYKKSLTSSQQDWYLSVSGTVTLTNVDVTAKKISGTFEFTVANSSLETVTITNGVFNDLAYTEN